MTALPIIIQSRDPDVLSFFRSPAQAAAYLEPIDVEGNEYAAVFDVDGRRFQLTTRAVLRPFLLGLFRRKGEVVDVLPLDPEPSHAEELAGIIRGYLTRAGHPTSSSATLPELVAAALARVGYTS